MEAIWLRIVGAVFFVAGLVISYGPIRMSSAANLDIATASAMETVGTLVGQNLVLQTQAFRFELGMTSFAVGAILYGLGAVTAAVDRLNPPS